MKSKLIPVAASLALLVGGVSTASAALIDRGNGLIYDDDLDITWMADANYAATQYAESSGLEGDADGLMSWDAATAWANGLVYEGYSDWRLFNTNPSDANCSFSVSGTSPVQNYGYDCTGNELGHLFYDELGVAQDNAINMSANADLALFDNLQAYYYWSGTEYAPDTTIAWVFDANVGFLNGADKDYEFFAWAVRSGDVAAATVPEPGTVLLLVAGLIGIAGAKRRRC